MLNRSEAIYKLLNRQIRDNNLFYKKGDLMGRVSMIEIRGKITLAYELKLISYEQWEYLINKVFYIIDGE